MEINEVKEILQDVETKVNELKVMLSDYDACKGAKSKMYLLAAMSKFAAELGNVSTTARNA